MSNELTDKERIAVLETKVDALGAALTDISTKLDSLLELKAKGMGAISLVVLLAGSGIIGIAFTLWNIFRPGNHL